MNSVDKKQETKPRHGLYHLERRQYPRFSINLPFEYYRVDSPEVCSADTENISEGGLLVYAPERVKVGQRLKARLYFASVSDPVQSIEVLCEVAWVEEPPNADTKKFPCGVRFIDLREEDAEKLRRFIQTLSR